MTDAIRATRFAASLPSRARIVGAIDRWMFVFTAGLLVVTVLVGFIPDSIGLVQAVRTGLAPPLPPVLHVHAVLMGSWLLLLLAQTVLVATGRKALHRTLGWASLLILPAMVVAGAMLVPIVFHQLWDGLKAAPPAAAKPIEDALLLLSNVVLAQLRNAVVLPLLVAWALLARRSAPDLHKRLMILATVGPVPAAIDRMPWLPNSMPASPTADEFYVLLLIAPMLAWDIFRLGRVHRAYWIWLGANAPFIVMMQWLWGKPAWVALVPKLMGVS